MIFFAFSQMYSSFAPAVAPVTFTLWNEMSEHSATSLHSKRTMVLSFVVPLMFSKRIFSNFTLLVTGTSPGGAPKFCTIWNAVCTRSKIKFLKSAFLTKPIPPPPPVGGDPDTGPSQALKYIPWFMLGWTREGSRRIRTFSMWTLVT